MCASQFDLDFDDSEKISHQLRLSGGNEVLYISVPLHYSINKNFSLFFDAGINHEIFSNSKDINGVNGSDELFLSLENKSTDIPMTQSPQKMKIKNISSDDSDMTLANGSVELFSLPENESKEHRVVQIENQDNFPSTSSSLQRLTGVREDKPIIISSNDSDCDSLSQSILRRKHPMH
ncbi:unnamed protein product [Mytilus coruscus]|uniref:Uncharacterized protein n=1 Tax=Mytilus coruscus TaxID=42192 RepID=A0A6J8CMR1_MYTCO|nr:unnamed protein product [Mytilus coruscus]